MICGALVIDKPAGLTSHDVVARVRRLLGERRIGHLGPLDPFATGVLVLLTGNATRLARFYQKRDKSYNGTIRFGYSTDTFDSTGRPTSSETNPQLGGSDLDERFDHFRGEYMQTPPAHSAKKIRGKRAYELARKGVDPELQPSLVSIHELQIVDVNGSEVQFRARVSSGTYIRSLAHDMGRKLDTGAHLVRLRRTAVGEFTEQNAVPLSGLEEASNAAPRIVPATDLLPEFTSVEVPSSMLASTRNGNILSLDCAAPWIKLIETSGDLVAIAERVGAATYHPAIVFPSQP